MLQAWEAGLIKNVKTFGCMVRISANNRGEMYYGYILFSFPNWAKKRFFLIILLMREAYT
jgi:hypothetical protein